MESEVTIMTPGRTGTEYDLRHVGSRWKYGNFFELVVQYGYVLQEGENDVPPDLKRIWEDAMKIRQITTDYIIIGRTGAETFEIITRELTRAGFNVNHVQKFHKDQYPGKPQVSIDLHALGKGRNAPRIGSIVPDWEHGIPLPPFHHFMMEFFIYRALPAEYGEGKYLNLWFHDGALVTVKGVEFLSPPPTEIRLIH